MVLSSVDPDIDEKAIRHPMPDTLCVAIGKAKLDAVIAKLKEASATSSPMVKLEDVEYIVAGDQLAIYQPHNPTSNTPRTPFIYNTTLDTLIASIDGTAVPLPEAVAKGLVNFEIREKPETVEECKKFLGNYSDSFVQTVASIVMYHVPTGRTVHTVDVNTVFFSTIPESTMTAMIYKDGGEVPNGDCMSCCGGFVVEDPNLSKCVVRIHGCIEGVQGMNPSKLDGLINQLRSQEK